MPYNLQTVRERLFKESDEKYGKFSSGLLPDTENILGVRLPVLRKFAKEIVKNNGENEYLKESNLHYFEEILRQFLLFLLLLL